MDFVALVIKEAKILESQRWWQDRGCNMPKLRPPDHEFVLKRAEVPSVVVMLLVLPDSWKQILQMNDYGLF